MKKSGYRYFDLTPGGADGFKSMLATETSIAYEFWFASKREAAKKRCLELVKNFLKPLVQGKSFWGEDLSNLNMARMRLKLKLRFALKKLKGSGNREFVHFLESESIHVPWQEIYRKHAPLECQTEGFILRENHIFDLFFFDESSSLFPRMDIFADCIIRLGYGQTMFTLTRRKELISV